MASQASPASSNGSMRKEIFLPRPPLPFDCNHEGDESGRNQDIDEDWLPEIKDLLTGNFHVMIDMTSELDSEDDTKIPSRHIRSYSGPALQQPVLPDSSRLPIAKDFLGRASHRRPRISSIPSQLRSQSHPERLRQKYYEVKTNAKGFTVGADDAETNAPNLVATRTSSQHQRYFPSAEPSIQNDSKDDGTKPAKRTKVQDQEMKATNDKSEEGEYNEGENDKRVFYHHYLKSAQADNGYRSDEA